MLPPIANQIWITERLTFKQLPRGKGQEKLMPGYSVHTYIDTHREIRISEIASLHLPVDT